MGGVKEVRQLDDPRLHWVAEITGVRREWQASILEQVPDAKVAWAATSGATNAGAVRFEPVGSTSTIVHLTLEYEPEGVRVGTPGVEHAAGSEGDSGKAGVSGKAVAAVKSSGSKEEAPAAEVVGGTPPVGTRGIPAPGRTV
jgi:hypothetical protein